MVRSGQTHDDDDDDVARRFRENDDLGDASSIWYRATRPYFEDQSPVGEMRLLSTGPTIEEQLPLGLFTYTNRDRLIYWPAVSKGKQSVVLDDGTTLEVFDHITLEFPSEKMHLTCFDASGKKQHVSQEARTFRPDGVDLSICFEVLVKVDVVRDQDMELQRVVNVPLEHQPRMTEWLKDFSASFSCAQTKLTPEYKNRDYIRYTIFLDPQRLTEDQLRPVMPKLIDPNPGPYVDGWNREEEYETRFSRFIVVRLLHFLGVLKTDLRK